MQDTAETIKAVFRDRYELLDQLGEGGFGTVYKARQLATGQSVAIKVLRLPETDGSQAQAKRIARFQREMQICAQMHHPNIVRLMDSGQAADGIVYSVFAFVPGKNLAEVIAEEGRLDPFEVRHFMTQILDALACSHAQGVVHRDLKPANIMIIPTGARRNAVVLDFGIGALTQEARREDKERLTVSNESIGTPSYAAPEQLLGQPPTPQSDLYAWGLVFLECLTGKRVVDGATLAEVVFKQLSPDPIPIPDYIADHRLGRILRRVTSKNPEARDAAAQPLMRELEACDMSGLRQRTGPVQITPAAPDAATATINMPNAAYRPSPPSQRLVEGERRQITALCCSLSAAGVGPRAADVEELDQILGVHQEACTEIARRFEGHVAGALGDAVLFYFGYPAAREDDARRAARAALAMAAEIRRRSPALLAERKARVDLRIGIHTGLVVARELRDPTPTTGLGYVMGTTPKLATRLSGLAKAGTILLSGSTQRLLRKQFLLEEYGVRAVDDSTAPVETFVLREGDPSSGVRDMPLVGRERELATLLDLFTRTRGGAGQAALVSGEPGIGKSRLARELDERLGSEARTWLECRCTPDSVNSAFYPIVDLLDRLLDPQREGGSEVRLGKLEALLSLHGFDLSEVMPLFAPLLSMSLPSKWAPLDVSPQKQRELTRNAVLSLLFEMSEKEPVVLAIEDLHWADPSTVELLGQLVAEVGSARVLALFTARPEFTPPWPSNAALQIQLGRLGKPEIEQMAAKVTGGRGLPAEVLEQITNRTDGVPLFVEELILAMIEAGTLVEREDRYVLARPLSEHSIPSTLRDSLMARLDRIGGAKETAQVAAAIGREFTFELLREVSALDPAEVQEHLDKLVAAELAYRKRRLKNPAYLFKHALVRDAAYDSMLKRSRQGVHARITKALEEKFPSVVNDRPDLLAHHHAAAEQKREAIGYAQKATMSALQRSSFAEATSQARDALSWVDAIEAPEERAQTELGLNGMLTMGLMARQGYASPEVATTLARSQELLDTLGDGPHSMPTLWALFMYHHLRGYRLKARALAERMLTFAERTQDVGHELATLCLLAQALLTEGKFEEGRRQIDRALPLYEPAAHRGHAFMFGLDSRVYAHMTQANLLWFLGYPEQAIRHGQAAVDWGREVKHNESYLAALFYLAAIHFWQLERDRAMELTETVLEISERYGLGMLQSYGNIFRSWVKRDAEAAGRLVANLRAAGQECGMSAWSALCAELEIEVGQCDAALARLEATLRQGEESSELYYKAELLRLKGACLLARDASAERAAEDCFRQAIAVAQLQSARMLELKASTALARLLRQRGDIDAAKEAIRPIYAWFSEGHDTPLLREARELLD
ncbi:TOMM system kinase/cyclase fusion protein [Polyangium spumosum]|uniref:TOMM system kinase/cyclase fusion protein n=1 Tax=Polyangium spumosum TaxID=889282 RepID=A0A6N7PNE7_9BACT|nr:TOMM system kinase/cyclase fusion protein [Polyangium spumosum]MRG92326.1 TOMM system kinase/cyclase fusion protein [Polyangium spumosum]